MSIWPCRIGAVGVFDLAPPLAPFGKIGVAQDGEEPSLEVGPLLERLQMVPGLEQGFLHEVVGALLVAAERNGESAQAADFCYELVSQGGRDFAPQLFVSASLKVLKQAQEMLRYGFARDLVEDGTNVTADMSLQVRRQAAARVNRLMPTRGRRCAVVQLVAYTRHFSPPILGFRVALHNGFQYACLGNPG
jgi:hypothetical protein